MTFTVSIVVGNPKPKSRTLTVATTLIEQMLATGTYELDVIDLVDHADELFRWPSDTMAEVNARVASSDLAVFASPTYKATFTGMLKAFLDRYPSNALAGVTAIPLLTGGDRSHSMGPSVSLSPLLVELGATVPGRGLYFVVGEMDRIDELTREAADEYARNLRQLADVVQRLRRAGDGDD